MQRVHKLRRKDRSQDTKSLGRRLCAFMSVDGDSFLLDARPVRLQKSDVLGECPVVHVHAPAMQLFCVLV